MSLPVRVAALVVGVVAVVAVAVFVVIRYLLGGPPVEDYTSVASGGQVSVLMQEDPQNSVTDHPDWVSYFIKNPQTGNWDHTTDLKVPANTRVNVTILGYDGCTPLRNQLWGKVEGTIGNVEYVNGKPVSVLDSWASCAVGHTFAIPGLGLTVPVASPADPNANLCSQSPCTSGPHMTVAFSFRTPASGGDYIWQCRVPCGGGYLDGNGGPMSTVGFMTGEILVAG